jgi:Peptidoglycan-binding protein, CsiV
VKDLNTMRALRSLILLLTLVAPAAFADGLYQVEMILFRQLGEPATTLQFAPEDWAKGAQKISPDNQPSLALTDMATKLDASGSYKVLLHRAWQQTLSAAPSKMAVSSGQEQFGHFPIEGTVSLSLARFTDITADFWVNRLDSNGVLNTSERLTQTTRVKNGELTYIDNGALAMLIKVSPL